MLYPLNTAEGIPVTRGFPLEDRPGERVDHPHHVGFWFNYGDVNGLDFWNNSESIPVEEKEKYGSIIHKTFDKINSSDRGILEVTMMWVGPEGENLLRENTSFTFRGSANKRIIDRITRLTALDKDVSFKDNKEGLLAIRMARELELPSDAPFRATSGNIIDSDDLENQRATGMYRSSEGIEGAEVWGTRGKWMNLSGKIKNEHVSVTIFDHPGNIGYPTYWHARGYGLFAANPLGQKQFSDGREELNFNLSARESVTFKYRIVVSSGEKKLDVQLNKEFEDFKNNK